MMPSEGTKILQFNQYQQLDKAPFIIYEDLECLMERLMIVQIILKMHSQQKYANIFHQVFQCLQYRHLKPYKISMMYTEVKIA